MGWRGFLWQVHEDFRISCDGGVFKHRCYSNVYEVGRIKWVFISPLSIIDGDHELFFAAGVSTDPQQPFNGIILQLDHISGQMIEQSAIDYFADQQVCYVLIPGGASLSKTSQDDNPINFNDYEQVKKYYGIRE